MTAKLTLTVEKKVIEEAKIYAKNTGRSLSEIVENYLATIPKENNQNELSTKLKKMVGVVKLPINFDEKAELSAILENKHL